MTRAFDQVMRSASDTRTRLLAATIELIAEVGWTAVTSRAVAERAGVNNGVVHYHFSSMDALRRAATAYTLEAVLDESLEGVRLADSTAAALCGLGDALSALDMSSAPIVTTLEAMLHAPRDGEISALMSGMLGPLREALERKLQADVAAGRLAATIVTAPLAAALAALLDGLILHALIDPDLDIRAATHAIAALVDASQGAAQ